LQAARNYVAGDLDRRVGQGKLSEQEQRAGLLANLAFSTDLQSIADADLVVESIAEHEASKVAVLADIVSIVRRDTIIATNTSSLSVNKLAAAVAPGLCVLTLEDTEKARLRGLALSWLRADLALRRAQLDSGKAADRQEVQAKMRHWQQDTDFAGVRGEQALASLPQEERLAWASLWRDVAALLELASRK
jgi:hypothetical protein